MTASAPIPSSWRRSTEKSPEYTSVTILADKEEIGSDGTTGMNSYFLKDFIEDLADMARLQGAPCGR